MPNENELNLVFDPSIKTKDRLRPTARLDFSDILFLYSEK